MQSADLSMLGMWGFLSPRTFQNSLTVFWVQKKIPIGSSFMKHIGVADLKIYNQMELNTEGKILDSPRTVRRYKMTNMCLSAKGVTFILTLGTGLSMCGWLRFCAAMKDD